MENREFRNELQETWLGRFSKSHKVEKPEVKIVTTSDMILMGAIIGVVAVLA